MPAKLRAGSGFPFILPDDLANGETQPQFLVRVLSMEDEIRIADLRREFIACQDLKKRGEIIREALDVAILENRIDASKSVTAVLTSTECWQVINAATEGAGLTADELKKFVLLPSCETANCVGDVAAGSAAKE